MSVNEDGGPLLRTFNTHLLPLPLASELMWS